MPLGGLQSLREVEAFESVALEARGLPPSTYELLLRGCRKAPKRTAIRYFLRGAEYSRDTIRLRSRVSDAAMRLLRRERFAAPLVEFTFEELASYVTRTANLLGALGVTSTDVVSLMLPNLPETHFALWGSQAAGIVNPINPLLEPAVVSEIMRAAQSKVLVTVGELPGSDLWDKVREVVAHVPTLRHVVLIHGRGRCRVPVSRFWRVIHDYPGDSLTSGRAIEPEDTAALFHTGGTTALPKLARHTHGNEVAMCWVAYASGPDMNDDAMLVGLPLFHANAALGTGLGALAAGVTVVLAGPSGFRTAGVLDNFFAIASQHGVSCFSAVPTILAALMGKGGARPARCAIRWAAIGAAPCPVELHRAFESATGIRLVAVYGLTEATLLSARAPADAEARIGSAGIRLPYVRLRAFHVTADGIARPCGIDEVGVLGQSGPTVFPGYVDESHNRDLWLRDPDGEKWLNTGDLGRIDAEGHVWITGRAKELIIRGGHNLDPAPIEACLQSHPAVSLAAAVGRPDAHAGEIPVAYVSLKPGVHVAASELMEHAARGIAERAAVPKEVVIVDALPTTAVGKIFKPELVRREIERACRLELEASDGVERFAVGVRADRLRGLVADVRVTARGDAPVDAMERQLKERLGRYGFQWSLEIARG